MMPKHRVFYHWLAGLYSLEKIPEVRLHVIVIRTFERDAFGHWLLHHLGIVFLMPLLLVFGSHLARKAGIVITGRRVFASLWRQAQSELGDFQNAFRPLKTVRLRHFCVLIEPHVDGELAVVKSRGLDVGHITAI